MRNYRSLRGRLVGHFLFFSLAMLALAGCLAFLGARRALERSVLDRLSTVATLEENQIIRWVASQRREVVFLATLPEVSNLAEAVLAEAAPEARRRAAEDRLREFFAAVLSHKPDLEEILLLADTGGRIAVSTERDHEGQYRVSDSFFTEGRGGTYVRKVYPSPLTFEPTLTVSTPLSGPGGVRLGVLAAHLDLGQMDRIIQQRGSFGADGEIYLVDRFNVFISAARFGRDRFPRGVHSPGIDASVAGNAGDGLYSNYAGVPVLGVYRWIDALDLALLVEVTQSRAFAPARRIAGMIAGAGLLFAALFVAGTVLMARGIVKPLSLITAAASRVAEGDLTVAAPVVREDEIGMLARAFNDMTTKLRTLYDDLHREIAERRQAQEEREKSLTELKAKNAELERFVYTASHDLKSPLVTIKGFLGLLAKDVAAGRRERMEHDMERIGRAADTMARLLDELLELSRIGRVSNPFEEIDLGDLARETVDLVAGNIARLAVEVEIAPGLPVVIGDRLRLSEVFQNLIDNAVKFLDGQQQPRVEIGGRSQDGGTVCYVWDNGPGIDPRYHEKIFGLFERLDHSYEGTGIGLSLVKRIVEHHGGRIWVESDGLGHGATFCFTLGVRPVRPAAAG